MKLRNGLFLKKTSTAATILLTLVLSPLPGPAELYKYRKDGVWYYTDTPPREMVEKSEKLAESNPRAAAPSQGGTPLLTGYTARNPIERAAAATLTVKTSVGSGSGFFISPDGYIITNKHVVRVPRQQQEAVKSKIDQVEDRIDHYDRRIEEERQRIREFENRLNRIKAAAKAEHDPNRRQMYMEDYQANLKRYEAWKKDFEQRQSTYERGKKQFRDSRSDYTYRNSVANLSQTFTIVLADNTELYARLVMVSGDLDLALLKIDGYQTPCLIPGDTRQLAQSDPVYAIGSPAALQNSVSSGVFSGHERGYLQTNAKIYPGNSGGPLVDADGRVLGINSFKQITYKFEGLGFAIPIENALREFSSYLPVK